MESLEIWTELEIEPLEKPSEEIQESHKDAIWDGPKGATAGRSHMADSLGQTQDMREGLHLLVGLGTSRDSL